VLHGGSEAVWLDDVFERSAPGIQVVTAGQVARGKLLGAWCWSRWTAWHTRFDHHPPLGQRPGGQPVRRLASGQGTAALPGPTA